MRVALLTMIEPAGEGVGQPRAFLRVGGVSLARQQLGIALALKCEKIACIAREFGPELVELQHVAERAGAQFHVISGPRPLSGLVTAADEVMVLADGLFASTGEAVSLLERGLGVLVQPIEQGLAAGFERIDLNTASAGAMRLPGRLVERLAELPPDCDAASALQRIALQSGITQRSLPSGDGQAPFWTVVRDEAAAHALEPQWIRQRTHGAGMITAGQGIALLTVRAFGPAMLHAGSGSGVAMIAALVLTLLGGFAGWFGLLPLGLIVCAFGWVAWRVSGLLGRIESDSADGGKPQSWYSSALEWMFDAVLVLLVALALPEIPQIGRSAQAFPPLVFVGLLRLVPRALGGRWSTWLEDRALACIVLAFACAFGVAAKLVPGLAVLLLAAGILLPRGELRLTRP